MTEYRRAEAAELPEIIDFMNMVFSMSHKPHDFKSLISKAYADDRCMSPDHYIARVNGRIEGCVALLETPVVVLGETLRQAGVGSVSAHPYAHGAGHMRGCMKAMLQDADARGLELLSLGGNRQRYEYFGFSQGGVETKFELRDSNVKHAFGSVDIASIGFTPFDPYERESEALYNAQMMHADRSAGFRKICGCWNSDAWAVTVSGAYAGYLIATADGAGIHEIVLERESDCAAVLKAWLCQRALTRMNVSVPVWNVERMRMLSKAAQYVGVGYAEMYRVGDWKKNIRLWLTLKSRIARLYDGRLVLAIDGGAPVSIEVRNGEVFVEDTTDAPAWTGSRLEAQDLLLATNRWVDTSGLPLFVENWFPLPITCFRADGF